MNEPFDITWRDGAYYVSIPNYKGGTVVDASAFNALVKALTLAEDILSRAPFSNALWPNGMHPMTGIKQIRDALALVGSPKP